MARRTTRSIGSIIIIDVFDQRRHIHIPFGRQMLHNKLSEISYNVVLKKLFFCLYYFVLLCVWLPVFDCLIIMIFEPE